MGPDPPGWREAASDVGRPESGAREPTTGAAGFRFGGSWATAGAPTGTVLAVAMAMLVVELVASGRVVVVVAGAAVVVVAATVDDVVAQP